MCAVMIGFTLICSTGELVPWDREGDRNLRGDCSLSGVDGVDLEGEGS